MTWHDPFVWFCLIMQVGMVLLFGGLSACNWLDLVLGQIGGNVARVVILMTVPVLTLSTIKTVVFGL